VVLLAFSLLSLGPGFAQPQSPSITGRVQQNSSSTASQSVNTQAQKEHVLIILDASYSMRENLNGRRPRNGEESKMDIAKRTIHQVLQNVKPDVNVGLRVYGTSDNSFRACRATNLVSPIAANDRQKIDRAVSRLRPTGATPISLNLYYAMQQAFQGLQGKSTIILLSDGQETCSNTDPCTIAVNSVRRGVDVKINVVGFGLKDPSAGRQLKCIALSTFGKFYNTHTAAELADSLNNTLNIETKIQGQFILPDQSPSSEGQGSTTPATPIDTRTEDPEIPLLSAPAPKSRRR
jgi:hypothetical protein